HRPGVPCFRRQDAVHDRPVARRADGPAHAFYCAARLPDVDLLLPLRPRLPLAIMEITTRMGRIGFLLVEVALRADVVGDAPGDALVAADHHRGHPRERHAGHVERSARPVDLVPDTDAVIVD